MKIVFFAIIIIVACLSSCEKSDLIISPTLNKNDSILILEIENTTNKNFIVEIPALNNFFYQDEYDKFNSEYFTTENSLSIEPNSHDMDMYSNFSCNKIVLDSTYYINNYTPKFIDKKSRKKYYYKIKK